MQLLSCTPLLLGLIRCYLNLSCVWALSHGYYSTHPTREELGNICIIFYEYGTSLCGFASHRLLGTALDQNRPLVE